MEILNFRLLKHPLNWGIVWAILLIVGYAITAVHHGLAATPVPKADAGA